MIRMLCFTTALALATGVASAEQYWIAYEANDLPENEGWDRTWGDWQGPHHGDGAYRTVEDGVLTMDSLFDEGVYDYAYLDLPGQLDPGPGEVFVAEWRLKVDEVIGGYYDPAVGIDSDDAWQLGFGYYTDHVVSKFEDNVSIPITPGMFHEYRCLSSDMRTYELYIDGELAHQGTFWQGVMESHFGWGDVVSGAASLSHWDYVRFGVVPEPRSFLMLIGLCVCAGRRRAWLVEDI